MLASIKACGQEGLLSAQPMQAKAHCDSVSLKLLRKGCSADFRQRTSRDAELTVASMGHTAVARKDCCELPNHRLQLAFDFRCLSRDEGAAISS